MAACTDQECEVILARVRRNMHWIKPRLRKDPRADAVEGAYRLFYACPESMALFILEKALDEVEEASQ